MGTTLLRRPETAHHHCPGALSRAQSAAARRGGRAIWNVDKEIEVSAAIAAANITRVMVAHRPETLKSADRVIALDEGKLVKNYKVLADDKPKPAKKRSTKTFTGRGRVSDEPRFD